MRQEKSSFKNFPPEGTLIFKISQKKPLQLEIGNKKVRGIKFKMCAVRRLIFIPSQGFF